MYFEGFSMWEWARYCSWRSSYTQTQWFTWMSDPANHFHPLSWTLWYLGLQRESSLLDNLLSAIRDRDILGVIAAAFAIFLPHAPRGGTGPDGRVNHQQIGSRRDMMMRVRLSDKRRIKTILCMIASAYSLLFFCWGVCAGACGEVVGPTKKLIKVHWLPLRRAAV